MIRYNIATHKKVNVVRFALILGVLVLCSILCIYSALAQLADSSLQFRKEKQELQAIKDKIEKITESEEAQKKEIIKIKSRWKSKRSLLNEIIDSRMFPYINKLDQLEKILPAGVKVTNILISTKGKDKISMNLAALTSKKLVEAYDTFLDYDLRINNESQSKGFFRAVVSIVIKSPDSDVEAEAESKKVAESEAVEGKKLVTQQPKSLPEKSEKSVKSEDLRKPPLASPPRTEDLRRGLKSGGTRPDGRGGQTGGRLPRKVMRDEEGRRIRKPPPKFPPGVRGKIKKKPKEKAVKKEKDPEID